MRSRSAVPSSAAAALGLVGGFVARQTGRRELGGALTGRGPATCSLLTGGGPAGERAAMAESL
jgi:hypothetical protein